MRTHVSVSWGQICGRNRTSVTPRRKRGGCKSMPNRLGAVLTGGMDDDALLRGCGHRCHPGRRACLHVSRPSRRRASPTPAQAVRAFAGGRSRSSSGKSALSPISCPRCMPLGPQRRSALVPSPCSDWALREFPPIYVRALHDECRRAAERLDRNLIHVAGSRARLRR